MAKEKIVKTQEQINLEKLAKSDRIKAIKAAKKEAAKNEIKKSDSGFDVEKEHKIQVQKNSELRGKEYAVDIKKSYALSMKNAKTDEQKAHVESVLASHNFTKDS